MTENPTIQLPDFNIKDLAETAVLVRFRQRKPKNSSKDIQATSEIAAAKGASSDWCRVTKTLLNKDSLSPITKRMTAAYALHQELTLPWLDDGRRLLPAEMTRKYEEGMMTLWTEIEDEKKDLAKVWAGLRDEAAIRLGDLFNPDDYGYDADDYVGKFTIEWHSEPVPTADDFRVNGMLDSEKDRMKERLNEQLTKAMGTAMREPWERLHTALVGVAEILSDPDKQFRKNTLENLSALADVLPMLNLTKDPHLTELSNEMQEKLSGLDPKELRSNPEYREAAAADAQEILDAVSDFYGAQS